MAKRRQSYSARIASTALAKTFRRLGAASRPRPGRENLGGSWFRRGVPSACNCYYACESERVLRAPYRKQRAQMRFSFRGRTADRGSRPRAQCAHRRSRFFGRGSSRRCGDRRALAPLDALLKLALPFFGTASTGLFLKGREAGVEIADARKRWIFDLKIHPSISDAQGEVLEIGKPVLIRGGKQ
jgi:hypothetical protein